eukprot:gene22643-biopygen13295
MPGPPHQHPLATARRSRAPGNSGQPGDLGGPPPQASRDPRRGGTAATPARPRPRGRLPRGATPPPRRNEHGRGSHAGRTIGFNEAGPGRTRAAPFLPAESSPLSPLPPPPLERITGWAPLPQQHRGMATTCLHSRGLHTDFRESTRGANGWCSETNALPGTIPIGSARPRGAAYRRRSSSRRSMPCCTEACESSQQQEQEQYHGCVFRSPPCVVPP